MKRIIGLLLLMGLSAGYIEAKAELALASNSPLHYLDVEKPFNEASWVMTHNSTTRTHPRGASSYGKDNNRVVSDQRFGLKKQLEDGIRAFKIPPHMAVKFDKKTLLESLAPVTAAQKAIDVAQEAVKKADEAVIKARDALKDPESTFNSAKSKVDDAQHSLDEKKKKCNKLKWGAKTVCEKAFDALKKTLDHAKDALKSAKGAYEKAEGVVNAAVSKVDSAKKGADAKLKEYDRALEKFKKGRKGKKQPWVCHGASKRDTKGALGFMDFFKKLKIDDDKMKSAIVEWLFNSGMAPCVTDLSNEPMADTLNDMKAFLQKYPGEMLAVYWQPEDIDAQQLATIISKVIPAKMLYVPTEGQPWPAIKDLHGKMMFFMQKGPSGSDAEKDAFYKKYPWYKQYNSTGFASKYNFVADTISEADVKKALGKLMDLKRSTDIDIGSQGPNKVSYLFHFITGIGAKPPIASGFPLAAKTANKPEYITQRWNAFKDRYKAVPTFVCVDFYGIENVPETVKQLNLKLQAKKK